VNVYCKRTYFEKNKNAYPINGKEYGEDYVKWSLGKIYKCHKPEFDDIIEAYLIIESEIENTWSPISEKNFNKHFETLDDYRNRKIEQILK
jgi:hypothetical protein